MSCVRKPPRTASRFARTPHPRPLSRKLRGRGENYDLAPLRQCVHRVRGAATGTLPSAGAPHPPAPSPVNCTGEGENSIPLRQSVARVTSPPRSLWGRGRRGGRPPLAPHHPRHPEPSRTTPPPKLGEGSPAVARNERKAGRGRGSPQTQ